MSTQSKKKPTIVLRGSRLNVIYREPGKDDIIANHIHIDALRNALRRVSELIAVNNNVPSVNDYEFPEKNDKASEGSLPYVVKRDWYAGNGRALTKYENLIMHALSTNIGLGSSAPVLTFYPELAIMTIDRADHSQPIKEWFVAPCADPRLHNLGTMIESRYGVETGSLADENLLKKLQDERATFQNIWSVPRLEEHALSLPASIFLRRNEAGKFNLTEANAWQEIVCHSIFSRTVHEAGVRACSAGTVQDPLNMPFTHLADLFGKKSGSKVRIETKTFVGYYNTTRTIDNDAKKFYIRAKTTLTRTQAAGGSGGYVYNYTTRAQPVKISKKKKTTTSTKSSNTLANKRNVTAFDALNKLRSDFSGIYDTIIAHAMNIINDEKMQNQLSAQTSSQEIFDHWMKNCFLVNHTFSTSIAGSPTEIEDSVSGPYGRMGAYATSNVAIALLYEALVHVSGFQDINGQSLRSLFAPVFAQCEEDYKSTVSNPTAPKLFITFTDGKKINATFQDVLAEYKDAFLSWIKGSGVVAAKATRTKTQTGSNAAALVDTSADAAIAERAVVADYAAATPSGRGRTMGIESVRMSGRSPAPGSRTSSRSPSPSNANQMPTRFGNA